MFVLFVVVVIVIWIIIKILPKKRVPRTSATDTSPKLTGIPGLVTLTKDPDSSDPFDDDTTVARAKMVCGHVFSTDSMRSYMDSVLLSEDYIFRCMIPDCRREWSYHCVKHVACLDSDLTRKYEEKLALVYMMKACDMRQCSRCQTWCYRDNPRSKNVRCPRCCTSDTDHGFCWVCQKSWTSFSLDGCGNDDCTGIDPRIEVLQNCPLKTIQYSNWSEKIEDCPSIRACPKCGTLIEHKELCKQMKCGCGHDFCFSCLEPVDEMGRMKCSTCSTKACPPAPRQDESQVVGAK